MMNDAFDLPAVTETSVTWTKSVYSLMDLRAEKKPNLKLPTFILIESGIYGLSDLTTFSSGEILLFHCWKEQEHILAKGDKEMISIPLSFHQPLHLEPKYGGCKTLKDIVKAYKPPVKVTFDDTNSIFFYINQQLFNTASFGPVTLTASHYVDYAIASPVIDGAVKTNITFQVPIHLNIQVKVACSIGGVSMGSIQKKLRKINLKTPFHSHCPPHEKGILPSDDEEYIYINQKLGIVGYSNLIQDEYSYILAITPGKWGRSDYYKTLSTQPPTWTRQPQSPVQHDVTSKHVPVTTASATTVKPSPPKPAPRPAPKRVEQAGISIEGPHTPVIPSTTWSPKTPPPRAQCREEQAERAPWATSLKQHSNTSSKRETPSAGTPLQDPPVISTSNLEDIKRQLEEKLVLGSPNVSPNIPIQQSLIQRSPPNIYTHEPAPIQRHRSIATPKIVFDSKMARKVSNGNIQIEYNKQHTSPPASPPYYQEASSSVRTSFVTSYRQPNRPAPILTKPAVPQSDRPTIVSLDEVPLDVSSLSVEEVSQCLTLLNLGEYVGQFQTLQVDGELLKTLSPEDIEEQFKMGRLYARKIHMFANNGWRPKQT